MELSWIGLGSAIPLPTGGYGSSLTSQRHGVCSIMISLLTRIRVLVNATYWNLRPREIGSDGFTPLTSAQPRDREILRGSGGNALSATHCSSPCIKHPNLITRSQFRPSSTVGLYRPSTSPSLVSPETSDLLQTRVRVGSNRDKTPLQGRLQSSTSGRASPQRAKIGAIVEVVVGGLHNSSPILHHKSLSEAVCPPPYQATMP